jgi:CHAT domain-containing protein/tetratricopeptide (TPR) repeat protein
LTLAAGAFVHAAAEAQEAEVSLVLTGPDGVSLAESRVRDSGGPAELRAIARAGGDHLLELCSRSPDPFPVPFTLRLAELRPATDKDRAWIAAEVAFAQGERLQAIGSEESLRAAIEKYREARSEWRVAGDARGEGKTLSNAGATHYGLGDLPEALTCFKDSLALFVSAGDRDGQADALNNLGAVYDDLGEKEKALDHYQRALAGFQALGNRASEAGVSNNIGLLYYERGESRTSLGYHEAALAIREALGDDTGRAESLSNIGLVYQGWGENQRALDYDARALPLWKAVGDRQGEATTRNNVAGIYVALGDHEQALDEFRQALSLARAVGDRRTEVRILNGMGVVLQAIDRPGEAGDQYTRALEIARALPDPRGEAATLDNLGLLLMERKDKAAVSAFERSLELARSISNRVGEGRALTHLGRMKKASGDVEGARADFRTARAIAHTVGDRRGEADALHALARTERDAGNLDDARRLCEEGLAVVDELRSLVQRRDLRSSYLASAQQNYELYVDVLMRLHRREPAGGYDALALRAHEAARGRGLVDLLSETGADLRRGADAALVGREHELLRSLSAKLERQTRLQSTKHTDAEAAAVAGEIRDLMHERDELDVTIRHASPRYAALTRPEPLSLPQVRELLEPDTLLVEYALGDERSFAWAVSASTFEVRELPSRGEVEAVARRVHDLLVARNRPDARTTPAGRAQVERADAELPDAARSLGGILLDGFVGARTAKRLIVVADGALQYVPFTVLADPAARSGTFVPLGARSEMVSLPSLSMLAALRRELTGRPPAPKILAVLADPVFDEGDARVRAAAEHRLPARATAETAETATSTTDPLLRSAREVDGQTTLTRLPFTRREGEAILGLVPPAERTAAFDFDASRATALAPDLGSHRFVHFATHGFLNNVHPDLSGLVLSLVDRAGRRQPGFLPAADVFALHLPADLVVLSGCRTGLGKEVRGEGLVGLTQAFFYAGAARVLVSLWEVDDAATATLMARFYEGMLKEHLRPAAALEEAQTSVRKMKRWEAPYFWAAFVLEGEPR